MTDRGEREIVFEQRGSVGHILLSRPKALNALTLSMVMDMTGQLQAWSDDASIACIVIEGAGEKGFCAGGDIRALYESGKAGSDYWYEFYSNEYRLNTLIKEYPKPYIAVMNGITMGGGVGVSVNGSHRVVSDRTVFAMPETGIGLIPDVGGSFFLPRLKGAAGMYLGLTGNRMKAADCRYVGVGTHHVPDAELETLIVELSAVEAGARASTNIETVLGAFVTEPDDCPYKSIEAEVDRCFAGESVDAILTSLRDNESDWAEGILKLIGMKSPTSIMVTFEQLRRGGELSFREGMAQELRCVMKIRDGHDFYEGVRAVIIDKDNTPKWAPSTLNDVSSSDVTEHFDEIGEKELAFL